MELTRKEKSSRFNIKTGDLGRGLYPHCLTEAGTKSGCCLTVVLREAFLCRGFYIKVTETKVPKKKKGKKKNNLYKAFCCIQLFFFLNKWCQQCFCIHTNAGFEIVLFKGICADQSNSAAQWALWAARLPTFSCRTH